MSKYDVATLLEKFVSNLRNNLEKFSLGNQKDNHNVFKYSLVFFKSTFGDLIYGYCDIINQLPTNCFDRESNFSINMLYNELKNMRHEIIEKSQVLDSELEKLANKMNRTGNEKKDPSILSSKKIKLQNNQDNYVRSEDNYIPTHKPANNDVRISAMERSNDNQTNFVHSRDNYVSVPKQSELISSKHSELNDGRIVRTTTKTTSKKTFTNSNDFLVSNEKKDQSNLSSKKIKLQNNQDNYVRSEDNYIPAPKQTINDVRISALDHTSNNQTNFVRSHDNCVSLPKRTEFITAKHSVLSDGSIVRTTTKTTPKETFMNSNHFLVCNDKKDQSILSSKKINSQNYVRSEDDYIPASKKTNNDVRISALERSNDNQTNFIRSHDNCVSVPKRTEFITAKHSELSDGSIVRTTTKTTPKETFMKSNDFLVSNEKNDQSNLSNKKINSQNHQDNYIPAPKKTNNNHDNYVHNSALVHTSNNQTNDVHSHDNFVSVPKRSELISSKHSELNDGRIVRTTTKTISKETFTNSNTDNTYINNKNNDGTSREFDGLNFPDFERMKHILQSKFGLTEFLPNQLQVIINTLLGHDCFVIMPTGGVKSLCYQLPALLEEGVTIVVSPLNALILDQMTKLASLNINAKKLSGELKDDIYEYLRNTKILYITPEKLAISKEIFKDLYEKDLINRFVIDEVHCISDWGHDFRLAYNKLGELKELFPKVKIMALTATASPRLRLDILNQLKLNKPKWFISSLHRENLKYIVLNKQCPEDALNSIVDFIKSRPSENGGIIYCLSRENCEYVAKRMNSVGITARAYHAGLKNSLRVSIHNDWITNEVRVICATIAFGMGIDKPDVRFVIHYTIPKSIEAYYQESGRAGRDGKLAHCILYYNSEDVRRQQKLINSSTSASKEVKSVLNENLKHMVSYCENNVDCRRAQQLEYLGEDFQRDICLKNRTSACDNCLEQKYNKKIDALEEARKAANCVKELCMGNSCFTLFHIADVLKGDRNKEIVDNGHTKTPHYRVLRKWNKIDIQRLLRIMVAKEYLQENIIFINNIPQNYIFVGRKVEEIMQHSQNLDFVLTSKKQNVTTIKIEKDLKDQDQDPLEKIKYDCYLDLVKALSNFASELKVSVSKIINLRAIKLMAHNLPTTEDDMLRTPFITKANFDKYGKTLLKITQEYSKKYDNNANLYENEWSSKRLRMCDVSSDSDTLHDLEQSAANGHLRMSNDYLYSVSLDDLEQSAANVL